MNKLDSNLLLHSLAPPSIKNDARIAAALEALQRQLIPLEGHLDDGLFLCRIDELDSATLDHLAAQWNARVWRDSWPLELKRTSLKSIIQEKRRLGTLTAIKNAISSLGSAVIIREWWQCEPKRTPHTFEVVINQNSLPGVADEDLIYDLMRSLNYTKPVRSQYTITLTYKTQAFLKLPQVGRQLVFTRISIPKTLRGAASAVLPSINGTRYVASARVAALKKAPDHAKAHGQLIPSSTMRSLLSLRLGTKTGGADLLAQAQSSSVMGPRLLTSVRIRTAQR